MSTIDLSRSATDYRKHYKSVRAQQGRVFVDDDHNDNERIHGEDERRELVDIIGPAGAPGNGFALSNPRLTNGLLDFDIAAGAFYLGGNRLQLDTATTYQLQPDWLELFGNAAAVNPPAANRTDLVYVETWMQPVAAVEDSELFEVALGGPDSSTRMKQMQQIRLFTGIAGSDCQTGWAALVADLATQRRGALNQEDELIPDTRLTVTFVGGGQTDLCSPPVAGGYLGAENQAIRVQIVDQTTFTWGFDNAAPLYRVQLGADRAGALTVIKMLTEPKDQAHWPLAHQVVELLPWSAVLPNEEKTAEQHGFLTRVATSFDPDTSEFTIADAVPPTFGKAWQQRADAGTLAPPEFLYMRVWNRGSDTLSAPAIPFASGGAVNLGNTGLQVVFSGNDRPFDDYWIIAARPDSPDIVVPWQLMSSKGPNGPRRYFAPLGVIQWTLNAGVLTGTVVDDCRPTFLPLTRIKGCCTLTVGDGTHSYGNFSRIQDAINALPMSGGRVCVLAGTYDESVVIDSKAAISIHGCGSRTRVRAIVDRGGNPQPAFMISTSTQITLEDMAIESGPRSAVHITNSRQVTVRCCLIQMRDVPTLWQAIFSRADDVLIESNVLEVLPRGSRPPAPQVPPGPGQPGSPAGVDTPPDPITVGGATRGGIQLGGGSDRVRIVRNVIRGGIWNGITLGSISVIGSNDPGDNPDTPNSPDPCDPCKPVDLGEDPVEGRFRFESAGDLYDIEISCNRISDMGINGIGVVRFFNIGAGGDMVGVHGLHIYDNFITRCMRRDLALVSPSMQFLVGYGGIALAKVSDLRILRNEIVNNGASRIQPICGVFAIFVQGLQLDDNRIMNNGARTEAPAKDAQNGIRGGVHVWLVLPLIEISTSSAPPTKLAATDFSSPATNAVVPACSMRDNIIAAPLGRAVTLFALGYVVVNRNRLLTEATTGRGLDLVAATVLIGNLGFSNELTLGLLLVILWQFLGKSGRAGDQICQLAKGLGLINPNPPASFWPPLVRQWATGKTLLCENQITLDLTREPLGFGVSSAVVLSLDDVGFTDNQCEITTTNVFFFVDVLLLAGSVRLADNRLSETWMHAAFSGSTLGGMNTTTDNQSTHCLNATSFLNLRVFKDNLALVNAFCVDECGGV